MTPQFYLAETGLVSSGTYPNGQVTNSDYYGTNADERLQQIQNLGPSANVISQFNYGYDAEGEVTSWQQGNSGVSGSNGYGISYNADSELNWVSLSSGTAGGVTSYDYGYDNAGNRTQEQIDSATTSSGYNGLNELTTQSAGGLTHFRGTLNKWATVTVGGSSATVTGTAAPYQFDGVANLTTGTNTVPIIATGTSGVSGTNNYEVTVASGSGVSLSYDADGEMTNNGAGQSYQWDAANRLSKIWYGALGSSPCTTFIYNGVGQRVGIVETDGSGNVTSTKQFVWCPGGAQPSEERDANDNVTKRFFSEGEQIGGTNYYYTKDHLGTVREMTDASGAVQARYSYDLWGRQTVLSGSLTSDFGYAGYYQHLPSGLNLTMYRAYDPNSARWISRDPLGERRGGINLYDYVLNDPVDGFDPYGLVNWGGVFRATGGIIGNSLGFAGGFALGVGTGWTGVGAVAGAVVAVKSGYGVGANVLNLISAINDQGASNTGSLYNDVANTVAPGNQDLQKAATAADLATDLFAIEAGAGAETPDMVDSNGTVILEGGAPLGNFWTGNGDQAVDALAGLQVIQDLIDGLNPPDQNDIIGCQ